MKYKWKLMKIEESAGASWVIVDCDPNCEQVLYYVSDSDIDTIDILIKRHNEVVDTLEKERNYV